MAAKTFSITAAGTETGQQLDALTTSILIRGDLNGGTILLEASNADSNYTYVAKIGPGGFRVDSVNSLTLPGGWYVRVKTIEGTGAPTVTIVIE